MTVVVHQSELKTRRRCKKQWSFAYKEKIEKKKKPRPLLRGTVIHQMIENQIEGLDVWAPLEAMRKEYKKLFIEEQEEYGDLPQQMQMLMEGYFRWFENDKIRWIKYKGKKAEHDFSVPLDDHVTLDGRVDALARTKDKLKWMTDHKSYKTLPTGDAAYVDLQTNIYIRALDIEGYHIDGILWNYIRVKTPAIPDVLRSGELSRRQNIDTTWTVYRQAIKDAGLKISDYKDMRKLLADKEDDFYVRHWLPRNDNLIDNLVKDALQTSYEIQERPDDDSRTIDRHCDWCQYYSLCRAELLNLDTEWTRKNGYQKKKKR